MGFPNRAVSYPVLEEQFGMHCKDIPSTSSTFQQPDTEDGGKSYVLQLGLTARFLSEALGSQIVARQKPTEDFLQVKIRCN